MKHFLLLALALHSSYAFLFGGPNWNGFRAGFGVNPFSSYTFDALPRTVDEAVEWGYTLDKSAGGCGISGTYFHGNRYRLKGEQAIMILYDKNGFVAGIQAGIPKTMTAKYPGPQNALYKVFNEEADMWVTTAYFVEPSTICTVGRTQDEFDRDGTGTDLTFQTGPTPADLMKIPHKEDQVLTTTNFTTGRCFFGMGKHYWYDISDTMDCDRTFPVFLLYNGGDLTAFGWAFNPNFKNSERWEHPTKDIFDRFMLVPPPCLGNDGPTSTLHIYFTNQPWTNIC